jgi:hypothetical protein
MKRNTVVIMSASLAASLLVGAAVTAVAMPSVSRPVGASAAPNFAAAQHVCEAFGGDFVTDGPEGYGCLGVHNIPRAYPPAQRICENAYDGILHPRPQGYVCQISE